MSDFNTKRFGENVRAERKRNGVSQYELARKVNLSRGAIANVETGNSGLDLGNFARLCRALDCDPARLLKGTL